MGKMTFVVEFEDGKEPPVSANMDISGGRLVAAAFYDYRNDYFTDEQKDVIADLISHEEMEGFLSGESATELNAKLDLLTY
ncbi:TPA: hypothetical protein ACTYHK_001632 [Citrobacter koseri]|nr:hypothetical protein [Citrobacter koseri]HEM6838347.1 hypothetical protein [Citrobacter koseri]HEM8007185.1 hypothetical protein [Citrobacter koseri]